MRGVRASLKRSNSADCARIRWNSFSSSGESVPSMRNPCNRQLISIHVRLHFFDSRFRGFFAKNRAPLFEQPLRQLRDALGVLNQVANLNSAHTNSVFGLTRIRSATAAGSEPPSQRKCFNHLKTWLPSGEPARSRILSEVAAPSVRLREVVQGNRESGNGSHSNRVWCDDNVIAVGAKHRHTQGNHPHRLQQDDKAETMSRHVNVTR
jgi:hypothetical protein